MWVLILLTLSAQSVSVTTQEFSSFTSCIAAGKAADVLSTRVSVEYTCARK